MGKSIVWNSLIHGCVAVVLAAATVAPTHAQTHGAPPPIEQFFQNNAFGGAVLSPDGDFLAVRMSKPERRDFLAVIDLNSRSAKVVAEYHDADVGAFRWVNDTRLVYNVRDQTHASGNQNFVPGLFAVDRDGGRQVQLAAIRGRSSAPQPWNTFLLDQPGSQDSEWIYVERPLYDDYGKYFGTRLRRLNTLSGVAQVAPEPDVEVSSYMLDASGQPRLAVRVAGLDTILYYLQPDTGKWRELARFDQYKDFKNAIEPLGFGSDGTLYVIANGDDDVASLRTLDLATGKVSRDALVATPGYDFAGKLIQDKRLLGVRLTTDARATVWFDPAMKAMQAAVDRALPGTVNLISVPARSGAPWVLVESYSDVQPSWFRLYDTRSGVLDTIGASFPDIDPARMGRQEPIRFAARDGLEIPGLLTLPPGSRRKNLPMVVLVHGGPWVRGNSWGWDAQSQFLASRGYAVLEVEFRGSTGFGAKHFEAGLKQWGLAMQSDVADGARWAIAKGYADPHRICIAGASYGGYAALMGLVIDPELYRCGIEWLGVTDINLMYTGTWYSKPDLSDPYLRYGMPALIGDPVKDAAQLKATSPIRQAARISQPLLLAYGSEDERVPIYHGKKFYAAVKDSNPHVEWIEYSGEGHGWSLAKNRIDFWRRVEGFLDRWIGPHSHAASAGAEHAGDQGRVQAQDSNDRARLTGN
jgi:dipeptidyl aminopeptidase/acylaminoacyl peptidase